MAAGGYDMRSIKDPPTDLLGWGWQLSFPTAYDLMRDGKPNSDSSELSRSRNKATEDSTTDALSKACHIRHTIQKSADRGTCLPLHSKSPQSNTIIQVSSSCHYVLLKSHIRFAANSFQQVLEPSSKVVVEV